MDPALAQRTAQASAALFDGICSAIADERGVHLETALTAAGYLAGAAMLRNTGIDLSKLPPGSPVLVDAVNEVGPMVLDTIFGLIERGGVDAKTSLANPIPPDHAALKSFDELLPLVMPAFDHCVAQFDIPPPMQPFVAARACAQIILAGKDQLDPSILKAIVADAVVRGAKTVPPR